MYMINYKHNKTLKYLYATAQVIGGLAILFLIGADLDQLMGTAGF